MGCYMTALCNVFNQKLQWIIAIEITENKLYLLLRFSVDGKTLFS